MYKTSAWTTLFVRSIDIREHDYTKKSSTPIIFVNKYIFKVSDTPMYHVVVNMLISVLVYGI